MSYFKKCSSIERHDDDEIINFVNSVAGIDSLEPKPEKRFNVNLDKLPPEKQKALKVLFAITVKLIVGHIIRTFVDVNLSKFTIKTLTQTMNNKKLVDFLRNEINSVYEKHPTYKKCSAEEFKETTLFNYMAAEWRDKTEKEIAKNIGKKAIDDAITVLFARGIPIPGSSVLAIPVKMMLTYIGVNIGIGSVYTIAFELDGSTISVGVNYTRIGFTLTDLKLYCFKDSSKLVSVELKEPPKDIYKLDIDTAKEILKKYGANDKLDSLKKEVQKLNENTSKY